jgi:hypothetical protein
MKITIEQAYKILGHDKYWETLNAEYSGRFGSQGYVFLVDRLNQFNKLFEDDIYINFEKDTQEQTITMTPEGWDEIYKFITELMVDLSNLNCAVKPFVKDVLCRVSSNTTESVLYDAALRALPRKERIEFIEKNTI